MTFECFGRFLGGRSIIIQVEIELVKSSVGARGRPVLLSAATKEWLENLTRTRFEGRNRSPPQKFSIHFNAIVRWSSPPIRYAILFGIWNV
jgi:hypothetical protein